MIQTVLESGVVTVEKELWTTPIAIEGDSGSMDSVGGRVGGSVTGNTPLLRERALQVRILSP